MDDLTLDIDTFDKYSGFYGSFGTFWWVVRYLGLHIREDMDDMK